MVNSFSTGVSNTLASATARSSDGQFSPFMMRPNWRSVRMRARHTVQHGVGRRENVFVAKPGARTGKQRGGSLEHGDRLVVSELSRLGRSLGQIAAILDALAKAGVAFVAPRSSAT